LSAFWDGRYDRPDYYFGTEPAAFLTAHAGLVPAGAQALSVGDGEGRNATWLARQGCTVTAFDASSIAIGKARALAEARGVHVAFDHATIEDWDWSRQFDLVVAVFVQFADPPARAALFEGLRRALAPGGRLMLHGYTPKQLEYGTGGPGKVENLYTETMLRAAFPDLSILRLAAYEAELAEGAGHAGRSALIDLIADAPR
jgi:SAM-dependent methyltransferase